MPSNIRVKELKTTTLCTYLKVNSVSLSLYMQQIACTS